MEDIYTMLVIQTAFGEIKTQLAVNCHQQTVTLVRAIGAVLNSDCVVEETSPEGVRQRYIVRTTTTKYP